MPTFKTWSIGEVLTASDLNTAFSPIPLYASAITAQYTGGVYRDWETDRKSTRLNSSH